MTERLILLGLALIFMVVLYRAWRNRRFVTADSKPNREEKAARAAEVSRLRRRGAEPALRLIAADGAGFSKLGGDPELPAGIEWPLGEKGPRAFVAQIDLAAARSMGGPEWLPESGRVYVFYDPERHGFGNVLQVIYSRETLVGEARSREGLDLRFRARHLAFERMESLPSLDWLGMDYCELDDDFDDEQDLGVEHQLGGYPVEIQQERFPVTCECLARGLPEPKYGEDVEPSLLEASRDWRLLLQIDSDPGAQMNWGDAGRLFVLVRRSDAKRGDFSQAIGIWQTH